MPHVLHLVKSATDRTALDVIRAQATDPSIRLSIVLMDDARHLVEPLPGVVYRLDHGRPPGPGEAAPAGPPATIDASELLDLIFTADSVVTW
jgi:hypothetical protein